MSGSNKIVIALFAVLIETLAQVCIALSDTKTGLRI